MTWNVNEMKCGNEMLTKWNDNGKKCKWNEMWMKWNERIWNVNDMKCLWNEMWMTWNVNDMKC